jgi:hypothetical protein
MVISGGKKGCTGANLAINPLPKEINEGFIQNMELSIYGGFFRCCFILFFLHGFVWGLPEFSQYSFNFSSSNNHLFNVNVGPNNVKFLKFLALILLETCNVVLHLIFDHVEKAYLAFHSIFELFPLVLV